MLSAEGAKHLAFLWKNRDPSPPKAAQGDIPEVLLVALSLNSNAWSGRKLCRPRSAGRLFAWPGPKTIATEHTSVTRLRRVVTATACTRTFQVNITRTCFISSGYIDAGVL